MSTIGHNSSAFNETLRADIEALLNEDSERLFNYAQWHIGDYINGTMGMTLEHEGAYQRFLMRLYARGKPLPDDDDFMATAMSLSRTIWRRVKAALVAMGKIIVKAGCLTNSRFEKERLRRAEQLRKRSMAAQTRWQMERENAAEGKAGAKKNKNSDENLGKNLEKILEITPLKPNEIKETPHASAYANQNPVSIKKASLSTREDYDALAEKLFSAGGDALSDASPALITLSEPIRWLENGCDLEADILPAIRKAVHRKRRNEIQGWWYFTDAVREARDRRLMPMEAPQARLALPSPSAQPHWKDREDAKSKRISEELAKAAAKIENEKRGVR